MIERERRRRKATREAANNIHRLSADTPRLAPRGVRPDYPNEPPRSFGLAAAGAGPTHPDPAAFRTPPSLPGSSVLNAATPSPGKRSFRLAHRDNSSLLASVEKKSLVWLAHRAPSWINSDHLTVLGLVAMLLAGISYFLARWHPAGLLLVILWLGVNWLGDSLDGTLARVRDRQRPRYGFYVDHIVDTFGTFFLLAGMALSGYMSPPVAAGLLFAYYVLSINIYLATHALGVFRLSVARIGPTELRILIATGNLVAFFQPRVRLLGETYLFFDVAGLIAMVIILAVALSSVGRNTLTLYREEQV